ncbi:MAG: hypothetical protein Q8K78_15510, partial [Planctomycetaceae bacterium]|nr:hypothetical protein [Planctomycetaceae bacterium]
CPFRCGAAEHPIFATERWLNRYVCVVSAEEEKPHSQNQTITLQRKPRYRRDTVCPSGNIGL